MRISDWSSDVCSSDLRTIGSSLAEGFRMQGRCVDSASMPPGCGAVQVGQGGGTRRRVHVAVMGAAARAPKPLRQRRSEEHTSELQSLMRISYAVFCLKKKTKRKTQTSLNCVKDTCDKIELYN